MATKAQLEAELADLRQQLSQKEVEQKPDPADPPEQLAFSDLLQSHGVNPDEIETLWHQFSKELNEIPEQKPLLTAIAAFGLGFVLGRMTKS